MSNTIQIYIYPVKEYEDEIATRWIRKNPKNRLLVHPTNLKRGCGNSGTTAFKRVVTLLAYNAIAANVDILYVQTDDEELSQFIKDCNSASALYNKKIDYLPFNSLCL